MAEDVAKMALFARKALSMKKTLVNQSYAMSYDVVMNYGLFGRRINNREPLIETTLPGQEPKTILPLRIYHKSKTQNRVEIDLISSFSIFIQNGDSSWVNLPNSIYRFKSLHNDCNPETLFLSKVFELFSTNKMLDKLDEYKIQLSYNGVRLFENKNCYNIDYINKTDTISYYFEENSYLLVGLEQKIELNDAKLNIVACYDELPANNKYFALSKMSLTLLEKNHSKTKSERIKIDIINPHIDFDAKLEDKHFIPQKVLTEDEYRNGNYEFDDKPDDFDDK
jgi:hypothetical protein